MNRVKGLILFLSCCCKSWMWDKFAPTDTDYREDELWWEKDPIGITAEVTIVAAFSPSEFLYWKTLVTTVSGVISACMAAHTAPTAWSGFLYFSASLVNGSVLQNFISVISLQAAAESLRHERNEKGGYESHDFLIESELFFHLENRWTVECPIYDRILKLLTAIFVLVFPSLLLITLPGFVWFMLPVMIMAFCVSVIAFFALRLASDITIAVVKCFEPEQRSVKNYWQYYQILFRTTITAVCINLFFSAMIQWSTMFSILSFTGRGAPDDRGTSSYVFADEVAFGKGWLEVPFYYLQVSATECYWFDMLQTGWKVWEMIATHF
jgi:hypothetical protein